ncbi:penicillin-binding protein [Membranihabitans maritimus]|uniref:penicillin-binding protein n=1 Tax=Membranihabitans maritimus TaxID=2904244 RepID=UPI001F2346F9|nr:penicillin-binding protein [Membranihabitans maritimus]
MSVRKEILGRAYFVFCLFLLVGAVILGKVIMIDTVERSFWVEKGNSQSIKKQVVKAHRGNIYADDGGLLATSIPFFDVRIDFGSSAMRQRYFDDNVDSLAVCLQRDIWPSKSVGAIRSELVTARKNKIRYFLIKRDATFEEVEKIKKYPLLSMSGYKGGLVLERNSNRLKPYVNLASRSIGRMPGDRQPVGLELSYNEVLKGNHGERYVQRIGRGTYIPVEGLLNTEAEEGADLQTTLNVNLQDIAEHSLRKVLEDHEGEWGTAIVMEVKTGKVKAIANLGKNGESYYENLNYGVGRLYEPGSTFKLATMLALFEDQDMSLEEEVEIGPGYMVVGPGVIRDSEGHPFKKTTVANAFAISSNVAIAKLANKYFREGDGPDRFFKYMNQFHLKSKTGIEIPGEPLPDLYSKDEREKIPSKKGTWSSIMSIPYMAHGYELRLTPLQVLSFYNAIANNGFYVQPRLGDKIVKSGTLVKDLTKNNKSVQIASKESIVKAQTILKAVVDSGTGKNLISKDYSVAGKTGTTRTNYADKEASRKKYTASFVGYFPTEDPIYSCIVVIDDPKKNKYYGSKIAAPVFKEIVDYCYATNPDLMEVLNEEPMLTTANLRIPTFEVGYTEDYEKVFGYLGLKTRKSTDSKWSLLTQDSTDFNLEPRKISEEVIPNVLGMGLKDALFILENMGIEVKISGSGKVTEQSLEPGEPLKKEQIFLTLG